MIILEILPIITTYIANVLKDDWYVVLADCVYY